MSFFQARKWRPSTIVFFIYYVFVAIFIEGNSALHFSLTQIRSCFRNLLCCSYWEPCWFSWSCCGWCWCWEWYSLTICCPGVLWILNKEVCGFLFLVHYFLCLSIYAYNLKWTDLAESFVVSFRLVRNMFMP